MKKIFFVLPAMVSGGAERKVAILLKYFQRKNYNLTLVLFKKVGVQLNIIPSGIRIIDLNKKSRWDFIKLIVKLGSLLQKEKPDKIFSFIYYANIITIFAKMFGGCNIEIIINEVSFSRKYLLHASFGFIKKWLMLFTYRRANKIICISKALSNFIIRDFRLLDKKVFTIYNPIDLEQVQKLSFEYISHPFLEKRKEGYQLIISVGRLTTQKAFDVLLNAFAKVKNKRKVLLLILGDGELLQYLKSLRKELKLNDSVNFLGYISNPYAWMSKADLFVMASQWEGFGSVIIEAMACGAPVIFTDCPVGPNEIITHGVNGMLVPLGDPNAISEAIIQLLDDSNLRKELSDAGRKRAKDFRIEKIGQEYEHVLEHII